ncbi:hypothetical protein HY948_03030, partial [Candidatus Gottesmanbacteria bacterium]|nr:hypothetical protein [Candidatus Gottesmanbacteria bacterium]
MKKNHHAIIALLSLTLLFGLAPTVQADETPANVTIHLTVITDSQTLYDQDLTVSACESSPAEGGASAVSGYCAVLQSGLDSTWSWFGSDGFLDSLGGVANDFSQNTYWGWFGDLVYG